MIYTDQRPTSW